MELDLKITGMTCSHCSARVTEALQVRCNSSLAASNAALAAAVVLSALASQSGIVISSAGLP